MLIVLLADTAVSVGELGVDRLLLGVNKGDGIVPERNKGEGELLRLLLLEII